MEHWKKMWREFTSDFAGKSLVVLLIFVVIVALIVIPLMLYL